MDKTLKINPEKVQYDGHSFRLIIKDENKLLERLKKIQKQIMKDLNLEEKK